MNKTLDTLLDERGEQHRLEYEAARKKDVVLTKFLDDRPADVNILSYRHSDITGQIRVHLLTDGGAEFEIIYNIPSEVVGISYRYFKLSNMTPDEFWTDPKVLDAIIEDSRRYKRQ